MKQVSLNEICFILISFILFVNTSHVFSYKFFDILKRDHIKVIIQIRMHRIRNNHEFLIIRILAVLYHICIGILRKIAGMSLL